MVLLEVSVWISEQLKFKTQLECHGKDVQTGKTQPSSCKSESFKITLRFIHSFSQQMCAAHDRNHYWYICVSSHPVSALNLWDYISAMCQSREKINKKPSVSVLLFLKRRTSKACSLIRKGVTRKIQGLFGVRHFWKYLTIFKVFLVITILFLFYGLGGFGFFFFFWIILAVSHVGSEVSDQRLNPYPLHWKGSLNHWTIRERPDLFAFYFHNNLRVRGY